MKQHILIAALVTFFLSVNPVEAAKKVRPTVTPTPTFIPKSICIDAGHGGPEEIGTTNADLLEKNVNLDVALLLRDKLIAEAGYIKDETLFMTRETDVAMTNADRYDFCNSKNTAILVSIHHNGSTDSSVDYSLGLYMKDSDILLAQQIVSLVSTALGIKSNGISRFPSGVLLKSNMPATISEGFFLTNTNEYNLIKNSDRLIQETNALFTGIKNYFE